MTKNNLLPHSSPIALTFDIDWAPDWCIQTCLDLCRNANVKATFFVTHPSSVLQNIAADTRFELGIHPNFSSTTTQLLPTVTPSEHMHIRTHEETRISAVLDYCLSLVPQARSIRTHGLWKCSNMYACIEESYPSIQYDVSTFIPSAISPQFWDIRYSSTVHRPLRYFSYIWEDDMACLDPKWHWPKISTFTHHKKEKCYIYI